MAQPKQSATGESDAYLEIPAQDLALYQELIQAARLRFAVVKVQLSLELERPQIYLTKQQRLYVGAGTISALLEGLVGLMAESPLGELEA